MRIFIVENSTYLQERLARLVTRLHEAEVVGFAANARDAVDRVRQQRPDIVLLDIRLDGSSGLTVLQELKRLAQAPVIIVLTNFPYPQYRTRFLAAGADYFLDKSTELDQLVQILSQLRSRFHWHTPHHVQAPTARLEHHPEASGLNPSSSIAGHWPVRKS